MSLHFGDLQAGSFCVMSEARVAVLAVVWPRLTEDVPVYGGSG
ncbi:MAG TPA: hypothetical protein VE029_02090 [Rhizobacter sp.]|nr:hypothetical protein [Rhizobacter sp.]